MIFDTAAGTDIDVEAMPFKKAVLHQQPTPYPQQQQQQFFDLKLAEIRRQQAQAQGLQQ